MILVTGAAGKTGQALLRRLVRRGASVRGLVRTAEQAASLVELGLEDVVVGDLTAAEDLRRATEEIETIYHICPNMHAHETAIGLALLEAARASRVARIVYHSVLHPQTEEMAHHWQKLRVEEAIFRSGLDFTILQPAPYMQNLLAGWTAIMDQGAYRVPYAADTRLSLIDLEDVAEIGERVLTEAGHESASYELVGATALSQTEVAATLSAALGRPIRAEAVARDLWRQTARQNGLSDYAIETLNAMFAYYERFGLVGNPRLAQMLLGRPPTSLAEFIRRHAGGS